MAMCLPSSMNVIGPGPEVRFCSLARVEPWSGFILPERRLWGWTPASSTGRLFDHVAAGSRRPLPTDLRASDKLCGLQRATSYEC